MVLMNKKLYGEYRELIVQKEEEKLQKKVRELNELLFADYLQDFLENSGRKIEKELENTERFKQIFLPVVNNKVSYQIGFFVALLNVFEALVYKSKKKHSFETKIKALTEKANMNKILKYLYYNPNSQHKVVVENTQLKANYLSELMRELENAGCVERYGVGKRSFYSLSLNANEFMKNQQNQKCMLETKQKVSSKYNRLWLEPMFGNEQMGILSEKYKTFAAETESLHV